MADLELATLGYALAPGSTESCLRFVAAVLDGVPDPMDSRGVNTPIAEEMCETMKDLADAIRDGMERDRSAGGLVAALLNAHGCMVQVCSVLDQEYGEMHMATTDGELGRTAAVPAEGLGLGRLLNPVTLPWVGAKRGYSTCRSRRRLRSDCTAIPSSSSRLASACWSLSSATLFSRCRSLQQCFHRSGRTLMALPHSGHWVFLAWSPATARPAP